MATPPVPPAEDSAEELTAATRHLCAGTYVDEDFRDLVIDKVCASPHRRVAPSYGFDIVPVMRHAWRAATLTAALRVTLLTSVIAPPTRTPCLRAFSSHAASPSCVCSAWPCSYIGATASPKPIESPYDAPRSGSFAIGAASNGSSREESRRSHGRCNASEASRSAW